MRSDTLQIVWHTRKPVFSVDIHLQSGTLATGGADNDVKIWHIGAAAPALGTIAADQQQQQQQRAGAMQVRFHSLMERSTPSPATAPSHSHTNDSGSSMLFLVCF